MKIEINIKITPDKVTITSPNADTYISVPNQLAYHVDRKVIQAIGENRETMQNINESAWEEVKHEVDFAPIYDALAFNEEYLTESIWYFVNRIRDKVRPGALFLIGFLDKVEAKLILPRYESIHENTRRSLEYKIQERAGLNRLVINGKIVGWPKWKIKTAGSYLPNATYILLIAIFLIVIFPVILNGFPEGSNGPIDTWQDVVYLVLFLGLITIIGGCVVYMIRTITTIVWMIVGGKLFSKDLLRNIYPLYRDEEVLFPKIIDRMANVLLNESEKF
jgi:hypothetical protein